MSSPASIKGHPIHVMLIPIPIGLWIFALVADLMTAAFGSHDWRMVAYYSLGGGIVGALLAAVPGLIDLVSIRDRAARRIGLAHMAINLAAVGVFGLNFLMRWNAPDHEGSLVVTLLGVALIGVSGWLGGTMVYRHGVAVDTEAPLGSGLHGHGRA